jgi:hypothetical protein
MDTSAARELRKFIRSFMKKISQRIFIPRSDIMSKQVKILKQKIKARLEKISKHKNKLNKFKKQLKKQK